MVGRCISYWNSPFLQKVFLGIFVEIPSIRSAILLTEEIRRSPVAVDGEHPIIYRVFLHLTWFSRRISEPSTVSLLLIWCFCWSCCHVIGTSGPKCRSNIHHVSSGSSPPFFLPTTHPKKLKNLPWGSMQNGIYPLNPWMVDFLMVSISRYTSKRQLPGFYGWNYVSFFCGPKKLESVRHMQHHPSSSASADKDDLMLLFCVARRKFATNPHRRYRPWRGPTVVREWGKVFSSTKCC